MWYIKFNANDNDAGELRLLVEVGVIDVKTTNANKMLSAVHYKIKRVRIASHLLQRSVIGREK